MDQTLAVYLPADRRHALVTGTPLPEHALGAALFADTSGFTPLTEALTRALGTRRGAEALPHQLNLVYDAIIFEVDRFGGSVISFAGDAIICWFAGDTGLRAVACGLAMQEAMRAFASISLPSGGTASLAMKVAVAAGPVRRLLVGDPRVQLLEVLAGATVNRMAAAEQQALKGELLLDEATTRALGEALEVQSWRTDEAGARFAVVAGLRVPVALQPWEPLPADSLQAAVLRPWLLPVIYERMGAGQGEFLTELRPAIALFLRFGGIDYDADPEAGQKLAAYIGWVQQVVTQYEGTLIQLTLGEKGSYLYAAFGAPIAHEDDALRAALTALVLRTPPQNLAFITPVQIGLTRGTMRTGAYGGSTRRTYGSLGDEVNLAARLMQHARPGQIIASGRMQAATAPLLIWQSLSAIYVKGKSDPIPIFVLLGEQSATTIRLQEPRYTLPMVGRRAELTLLEERMAQVLSGQGQGVGITAEAGMGKSRLVAELIRRAQARGFTCYGGECQSFGADTPYLVWQPIWRAFFALDETSPPEVQQQTLEAELTRLNPSLLPRLPLLGRVLDLPLPDNDLTRAFTPELRKVSLEAMLIDLLKARASTTPLLLVLEDTHWLDLLSQELLDRVARTIWSERVLLVLAFRPLAAFARPTPAALGLPHFSQLSLAALTLPEATALVDAKLRERHGPPYDVLSPAVMAQLMARTEGNPFYMEELINYLHELELDLLDPTVLSQAELPSSLHALILGRMDQLTEPQKITMKVASVIGRLFRFGWLVGYYPALGEPGAVRGHLEELRQLDLTPLESTEPELIYLFKHIVTQEVAYESLTYGMRATLHEQLARFIESLADKTAELYLDLLAYHYARSENLAKKRHYLRRAGEATQAAFANGAAQAYYERLLPLLEEPDEQADIHLRLGNVLELVGAWEQAEAHYRAARAVAAPTAEAQSLVALGRLHRLRGEYDEALAWLTEALARWEELDHLGGCSQTLTEMGWVAYQQGDAPRAVTYLEQSRALCQATSARADLANTLNMLGHLAYFQGDYPRARTLFEESLVLRRELADKRAVAGSLSNLGMAIASLGDKAATQAFLEESLALFREMGDKRGITGVLGNLGHVVLEEARYAEAQGLLEEALSLARETGDRSSEVLCEVFVGYAAHWQGKATEAVRHLCAAVRLAHEIGYKGAVIYSLVGLAAVAAQDSLAMRRTAMSLLGAAAALSEALAYTLEPLERGLYDETMTTLRASLNDTDLATAWAAGQALTLDTAVALALAEISSVSHSA